MRKEPEVARKLQEAVSRQNCPGVTIALSSKRKLVGNDDSVPSSPLSKTGVPELVWHPGVEREKASGALSAGLHHKAFWG